MALVSVLIPAYNHEDYIKKTLDTILNDSFPDKEIVIIDDGSTDNTNSVISEWIDKNKSSIEINYKSRQNRGLTKTLNELLSMAKGEYIVTLGSDDYLLEGGLQKRYEYLKKHKEKYAVFADCIVIDAKCKLISSSALFEFRHMRKDRLFSDDGIRKEFLSNFALPGPVLMVRKRFYEEFGGYDEDIYMEDLHLYLKLASRSLIGFIDEKVSAYRIHETNMSSVKNENFIKLLEDSKKVLLTYKDDFYGFDKFLLYSAIIKFSMRINLYKIFKRHF